MKIIIAICVLAAAVVCLLLLNKAKPSCKRNFDLTETNTGLKKEASSRQMKINSSDLISLEMLSPEVIPEENLTEITDKNVLARIDNLIPGFAQTAISADNAVQAVKSAEEVLYKAIIPANAKLVNSKATEGAVRGFYRNSKNIKGHADWMEVKPEKGAAIAANSAAAAMNVASMVVGQYYMAQIDQQLGEISDGISKISSFQDNEFKSRVFSLIAHVKGISDFQAEIIDNSELRCSKITQLDRLEEECTKLLGQADLTLADYAKKDKLNYESYEKELKSAQSWYIYQKSLLDVLYKISDLKYTLQLGFVSIEQCTAFLPTYTEQVRNTCEIVAGWHGNTIKRLNIDIDENRRKRLGLDGAVHFIPGLFNDNFRFKAIDEATSYIISAQKSVWSSDFPYNTTDFYNEDVQIISKNGKVYYLPETAQSV